MTRPRGRPARPTAARSAPLPRAIARYRAAAELTQTELADALGIGLVTLQRWEAGTQEPSASRVVALASALGVGVGDLLG